VKILFLIGYCEGKKIETDSPTAIVLALSVEIAGMPKYVYFELFKFCYFLEFKTNRNICLQQNN
jgi:hypothetical protein